MNYPVNSEQTPLEQFLALITDDAQREDVMMVATSLGLPPDDPALPLLVAAGWYRSLLCEIPNELQRIVSQFGQTEQQGIQRISQILRSQTEDIEQTKTALNAVLDSSLKQFEHSFAEGVTALNDAKQGFREDAKVVIQHSNKISDAAQSIGAELKKLTAETQRLRDVSHHLNTKAAFAFIGMGIFMGGLLIVSFYQTRIIPRLTVKAVRADTYENFIRSRFDDIDTASTWGDIRDSCKAQKESGASSCTLNIEF